MGVVIETKNLTKYYGELLAVRDLNLTVYEGDCYGFLGPNGAGKTTTIKMLTGFLRPTTGTAKIFGYDVNEKSAKRMFGYVPDFYGFYDDLTGNDNLKFYSALYKIPKSKRLERITEVLEIVDLLERKDAKVKTYSHGMRQRLVIAQALLHEPKLLLLDEPTGGLDPKSQYETRELLKKLVNEGTTIFISSHQLFEIEDMCNRVGIIHKGELLREDTIENLTTDIKKVTGITIKVHLVHVSEQILDSLREMNDVIDVSVNDTVIEVKVSKSGLVPEINKRLVASDAEILKIEETTPSLEQIFLRLTK
jgi:ABC-type multidrug transport system ATPase subunit